jgi:hypothetical protein
LILAFISASETLALKSRFSLHCPSSIAECFDASGSRFVKGFRHCRRRGACSQKHAASTFHAIAGGMGVFTSYRF